ncbi:MAG: hypothetical protein AAGA86_02625 [Bacteroidota bacterium]
MKKGLLHFSPFVVILFLLIGGCSTERDATQAEGTEIDIEALQEAITVGEWQITVYETNDVDFVIHYQGYVFTFNGEGVVGAATSNTVISGAWSVIDGANGNGLKGKAVEFRLFFAGPDIFRALTQGWEVKSQTENRLELVCKDSDQVLTTLVFESL